uniref:Uncharacterized protein n=1 Tax=Arundo donax TaxID=35708 RepID=A0A0A9G690_ARUDO
MKPKLKKFRLQYYTLRTAYRVMEITQL